jgi:DNA-binding MarR family transcriptional regulator
MKQMRDRDLGVEEFRALGEFRYFIRRFLRSSEDAARSVGLEPQQHQALLAIKSLNDPHGPSVTTISENLLIRHHSAVGLVDRLEERGLVVRSRGESDKRQVRVRLTDAGEEVLRKLAEQHWIELETSAPELARALSELVRRPLANDASEGM